MYFSTIFAQNLQNQQFYTVFLSSIQCNQCRECPFLAIGECGSDTEEPVFKALPNKDVMSFELCTRMFPGLKGPRRSFV